MTTQKVTPCEFVAGLCSNCGACGWKAIMPGEPCFVCNMKTETQQVAVPDALTGDQIIEWMRQRGLGTLDAENQALCVKLIRAYEENPKIEANP